jgi:two-component system response regulator FixJ
MTEQQRVFIVDDDAVVRDSIGILLQSAGFEVRSYASARQFLADDVAKVGCLIADVRMPDMSGLELQEELAARRIDLPVIIITGHGEVPLAVRAMKAGAIDFIEKPFDESQILDSLRRALETGSRNRSRAAEVSMAQKMLALLTPRELAVLDKLVKGRSNKVAAFELGISPRTIEIHRAHVMDKLKAANLSDLVRVALAAGREPGD